MMDTALRRRFDFVEMMPEPGLFKDTPLVKGINLELLLRKMNERIEVLYDREHTLGHAFLIPVANKADDQEAAFTELKLVFRNKIIPLLEEYFFEDWQKIRLVLGDNQKANASDLQFISETELEYTALFGHSYQPNSYQGESKVYQLAAFNDNNSAWHHPESYIGIYQSSNNSQG
jgi:5-methylcytosine-specific restriction protein B